MATMHEYTPRTSTGRRVRRVDMQHIRDTDVDDSLPVIPEPPIFSGDNADMPESSTKGKGRKISAVERIIAIETLRIFNAEIPGAAGDSGEDITENAFAGAIQKMGEFLMSVEMELLKNTGTVVKFIEIHDAFAAAMEKLKLNADAVPFTQRAKSAADAFRTVIQSVIGGDTYADLITEIGDNETPEVLKYIKSVVPQPVVAVPTGKPGQTRVSVVTEGTALPEALKRAVHIAYDGAVEGAAEEISALRREVADLNERERKRARTGTGGRRFERAEIEELRDMFAREAAYQKELNANPVVKFAVGVADRVGAKNSYVYISSTHGGMINEVFGDGAVKNTGWVMQTAASAMRLMGDTLRAFPGSAEELGSPDARESFAKVYKDLSSAVALMERRKLMVAELRRRMLPDTSGELADLLTPDLISRAEGVIDIAHRVNPEWADYGVTVRDVIYNANTLPMFINAVANDIVFTKKNVSAMPKSRMDRKILTKLRSESIVTLARYPPSEFMGMLGIPGAPARALTWGGPRVRYTAEGFPMSSII